ncbi:MAG TPA: cytosine permease [Solirubrobacteraceae bacterium]|nr:cytosine permease [Solirubrobacteraceae bacterium]
MSIVDHERQELTEAVHIDPHGIDPIPDADRDSTPVQQFWIWAGANIAPINWVLGGLGITLGLSLIETIVVITIGNLAGCALFGLFCVMGHRTGVNQMVLSRSAFGRRGAYVPGVAQLLLTMGWVGVNTWVVLDLTLGVLDEIGITGGTGLKYVIGFALMAVQVLIAIYGFYLIRTFEKYTVPIAAAIMLVMSVLAWTKSDVEWSNSTVSGADKVTSISQLLTAIGIGWGISWFTYSSDYTRFVARRYNDRQVFWATALGMFLPTVWLAALGASLVSTGSGNDPSTLVASAFGVMAVPVALLILHGPIATNILNLYSCSLAALSVGLRTARWKITAVAGVIGSGVLIAFIQSESFATSFDNWIVSIIVWISPWAGITLVEYFVLRRQQIDVPALYDPPETSKYGDVNWPAIVALVLGLAAGWAWEFGLVGPLQGPIAKALGDTDFSWAAGMLVAGGLYYALARHRTRDAATTERFARS